MSMDLNQLEYFISIVECGYNLSLAAKKIHISQSALSQFRSNFESEEQLLLFNRKNGRLESLTSAGKKIYQYALKMTELNEEMIETVRKEAARQHGTIRLGLPSLVLLVSFSSFIPKFILENKHIQIDLVEDGTLEIRRKLLEKDLNIAVLIEPTDLDSKSYEQHVIQIDEMTAFIREDHPLASKDKLTWEEILDYPLATFNESFRTYRLVSERLKRINGNKQLHFLSSSWDYLTSASEHTDIVTILPGPIRDYHREKKIVEKRFVDPIPFNVLLCRPVKEKYSAVEQLVFEEILEYFYQPVGG